MARSEAQRRADKKYRETHEEKCVAWGTMLPPEDAAELEAIRKKSGKGRAEFLRWATSRLKSEIEEGTTGG